MKCLGIWLTWAADVLYAFRRWRAGDLVDAWACEVLEC